MLLVNMCMCGCLSLCMYQCRYNRSDKFIRFSKSVNNDDDIKEGPVGMPSSKNLVHS